MDGRFDNRQAAGRALGEILAAMVFQAPPVVLALPRGGVPVAAEVARRLGAPLDLLLVRKIGAPWQPELALAALVEGDPPDLVIDEDIAGAAGAYRPHIEAEKAVALREMARQRRLYLDGWPAVDVAGRTAIVVDDGLATGTTARAALLALRRRHPAQLVLAVPVAPSDTVAGLRREVDRLVCLSEPHPFHAVGSHYADFHQVNDQEVLAALHDARPASNPMRGPP